VAAYTLKTAEGLTQILVPEYWCNNFNVDLRVRKTSIKLQPWSEARRKICHFNECSSCAMTGPMYPDPFLVL